MSAVTITAIVAATVAVTYLLIRNRRQRVSRAYYRFETARQVVTAAILVLIAWTFLNSGRPLLMFGAVLAIAFAVIYWYVERPDQEVV